MKFSPTPNVKIIPDYVDLDGGLDISTPALKLSPGSCIDSGNFVPDIMGGYMRVGGYERVSGLPKPSDAVYYVFTVALTGAVAVGDTLTGVTSAKTAKVIAKPSATQLIVTRLSGDFSAGESITVAATPVGSFSSSVQGGAETVELDIEYLRLAADEYRSSISAPPGSGAVLGVFRYKGIVYAFRNNAGGTASVMWRTTATGWELVPGLPALNPGGRYQFIKHNFSGATGADKIYGCDGKNKAFQWDGTNYTQITSTASPDTPSCIVAHKNRLVLSILGSLFISSPGNPTSGWAGVGVTPAEIGTGDILTGLLSLPGNNQTSSLAAYCQNKTSILYGSTTADWDMVTIDPESGAAFGTAQFVGGGFALDNRGITSLTLTQNFGNFEASTVSQKVQAFIVSRAGMAACSHILRSQNQYRVFFSDGLGLAMRVDSGQVNSIMPIALNDPITCCWSGEDENGDEVVYYGGANGMVYQAEIGTSFDGAAIEAWVRLAYNSARSPAVKKRWRRVNLEVKVPDYLKLYCSYEHDYGDERVAASLQLTQDTPGGGGYFDQVIWDEFTYDAPYLSPPTYKLDGASRNISLLFYANDAYSRTFTLQSLIVHYTPTRLVRT